MNQRSPEQQLQQQIEAWQALLKKLRGNESALASPHPAKRQSPEQQLQQQTEAWQVLLEKLGGNE